MLNRPVGEQERFSNFSDFMCWEKDFNSVFITANNYFANLLGFKDPKKLIGKTDYQINCPASDLAQVFQKHDKEVIKTKKAIKFFEIVKFVSGDAKISITTKAPLVDKNNNIIGTRGFSVDITQIFMQLDSLFEYRHQIVSANLSQGVYAVSLDKFSFLTASESECLFLLLYNKSVNDIADFLRLSLKAVEKTIAKLKIKFVVSTTAELIDLAVEQGFLYMIPPRFMSQQMSMVLD